MRYVIVTGMSGAGKSSVLKMLEDMDFFCVDNLPIPLIPKLTQLMIEESNSIDKAALGIDIRNFKSLTELGTVLEELHQKGYKYEILFLEAGTDILVKRYKETRRNHPLAAEGRIDKGIEAEREKLIFLKRDADYIIDTSRLLIRELKQEIDKIFIGEGNYNSFFITILSFGFKYGIPSDSDLVFDVRFLPNPFYVPELKAKTGLDHEVSDYVMESDASKLFLDKLEEMVTFLIPHYIMEGKNQLIIAIGCTGGKHRSVSLAIELGERMKQLDYGLKVENRDIEKE